MEIKAEELYRNRFNGEIVCISGHGTHSGEVVYFGSHGRQMKLQDWMFLKFYTLIVESDINNLLKKL